MESRIETTNIPESRRISAEKIMEQLKSMVQRAEEKAVDQAKAADRAIRGHPYQTVGVAFGVGLLIGLLAGRRS